MWYVLYLSQYPPGTIINHNSCTAGGGVQLFPSMTSPDPQLLIHFSQLRRIHDGKAKSKKLLAVHECQVRNKIHTMTTRERDTCEMGRKRWVTSSKVILCGRHQTWLKSLLSSKQRPSYQQTSVRIHQTLILSLKFL